jgi:hypothetical protein
MRKTIQADIVDRLRAYAEENDLTGAYTEANCAFDAIAEIERLRDALKKIGYDYVELSHEKVQLLYLEHIALARKTYEASFPRKSAEHKPLDDNF